MPLFGVKNKLTVNRLPLIRQGKALPPSPQGEGLRQRSLPKEESKDNAAYEMRKANKTFKTLYFRGGM